MVTPDLDCLENPTKEPQKYIEYQNSNGNTVSNNNNNNGNLHHHNEMNGDHNGEYNNLKSHIYILN